MGRHYHAHSPYQILSHSHSDRPMYWLHRLWSILRALGERFFPWCVHILESDSRMHWRMASAIRRTASAKGTRSRCT